MSYKVWLPLVVLGLAVLSRATGCGPHDDTTPSTPSKQPSCAPAVSQEPCAVDADCKGTGPVCSPDGTCHTGICSYPDNDPSAYDCACGSCGGKVKCDGTCSAPTPSNFGKKCNACSGTIECDGTCGPPPPANYGQACGSCGGMVQCDGSCSVSTPSNFGQSCGSCGGTIKCDGTCSVATPPNFGKTCGACGGTYQCDGSCPDGPSCNSQCGDACSDFGDGCGRRDCAGTCQAHPKCGDGQHCAAGRCVEDPKACCPSKYVCCGTCTDGACIGSCGYANECPK